MKQEVVLLAVTKMRAGFCLAGIVPGSGRWVRPVKDFGILQSGDILYPDRSPLSVFDRVALTCSKPRPQLPHTEDWICDFVRARPERMASLVDEARSLFLRTHAETDVTPVVSRFERSLLLASVPDPDELIVSFTLDAATGKLDARLACSALSLTASVPVTDLRWRALGRKLLTEQQVPSLHQSITSFFTERGVNVEQVYLALGLSREFEGRLWPLVVGVHCIPDFTVPLDLRQP